jgi:hypothetical protein
MARNLRLNDPDNAGLEVGPDDYDYKEFNPDSLQSNTINEITRLVTGALNYRRVVEPRVFECLAMYSGMQLLRYNYQMRTLQFSGGQGSTWAVRTTRPLIRPKIKRLHAKAYSHKPDASVKASSDSDIDKAAAEEGRGILSDNDHRVKRDRQTKKVGKWSMVTGICGLLTYHDPRGWAEVPNYQHEDPNDENSPLVYDEQGNPILIGSVMKRAGCMKQMIVPFPDLLLDPQAREEEELGWIGIRKVRTLADIRAMYPEWGPAVRPNAGTGIAATVESRMASVVGEYVRGAEPGPNKKNCAEVWELWFPVDPDFCPNGRHVVMSNNVLLADDQCWPGMDAKQLSAQGIRFPISLMMEEEQLGSLYPLSAVQDLIPSQRSINNTISRLEEHRNTSWGKLVFEAMSIPIDSFDMAKPNEKIAVTQGAQFPEILKAAEAPAWMFDILKVEEGYIDDISGLHETSEGNVPTGVTAAQAIMALAALDELMGAERASNIEHYHAHRAALELHVCGRNYTEERMMFVSQGYFGDPAKKLGLKPTGQQQGQTQQPGQPGQPQPATPSPQAPDAPPSALKRAQSFKALAAGGSCHLVITPGSALARDPVAARAEVIELYKAGLFGPVNMPSTAQIVLAALEFAGGDEIVEMMEDAAYKNMLLQMATAPNPAAQQQSDQDHQMAMEQLKAQFEDHKAQTKLAADSQLAQIKGQIEQDKINSQLEANKEIAEMQRELASAQAMLEHLNNRITASVTLSPQAQAAYEQETFGVSPSPAAAEMEHQANILATAAPAHANAIKQQQVDNQAQQSQQLQQQQMEQEQEQAEQAQPGATDSDDNTASGGQ